MVYRGQKVDWRLRENRGPCLTICVLGMVAVLLHSTIAIAAPPSLLLGSVFSASKEVPSDLIIAIGIFVAMFILRMGRAAKRQPVRQERPPTDQDQH